MRKLMLCVTALGGLCFAGMASAASLTVPAAPGAAKQGATNVTFWERGCHHADGAVSGFIDDGYDASTGFVDDADRDDDIYGFYGDEAPYAAFPDRYRSNRLWGDRRYYRRRAPDVDLNIGY